MHADRPNSRRPSRIWLYGPVFIALLLGFLSAFRAHSTVEQHPPANPGTQSDALAEPPLVWGS